MRLRWSWEAEQDLERIWHFLAESGVERADRVESNIFKGAERLVDFPQLGRPRRDGGRELSLPQIQYRIAYIVQEDRVLITAVRSTREDT